MAKKQKEIIDKLALKGKKLTKREKLMPILVVSVILFTLIIFLRPVLKSIKENRQKLKESEKLLSELKRERKTLEKISQPESYIRLENHYKNANEYLPSQKVSMPVLINLTSLARKEGIKFSGVTLNPGKIKEDISEKKEEKIKKDNLNSYKVEISISGQQNSIYNYIKEIRELAPMMKVEDISTSFNEDEEDRLYLNARMKLTVYYYELADVLASGDTKFNFITDEELIYLDNLNNYLFADENFQKQYSGTYGVVVGVTNPFSQDR